MTISDVNRAFTALTAAAVLYGCGAPPVTSFSEAAGLGRLPVARHGSWIDPGASNGPLLYASGYLPSTGYVTFMLSYPDGNVVGTLDTVGGMCSDQTGNVYITHRNSATEYAHGGTMPLRTLKIPGAEMRGCSVDPTTGNVAVIFSCPPCGYQSVGVFPPGSGSPTTYISGTSSYTCGYDGEGNLFVNDSQRLAELPNGSATFMTLTLDKDISFMSRVQWDGKNMTLQQENHPGWIYRFTVSGSTAHIMTATKFKTYLDRTNPSWIYQNTVVIPFNRRDESPDELGIWRYPRGGHAFKTIRKLSDGGEGFGSITVSAPPSR